MKNKVRELTIAAALVGGTIIGSRLYQGEEAKEALARAQEAGICPEDTKAPIMFINPLLERQYLARVVTGYFEFQTIFDDKFRRIRLTPLYIMTSSSLSDADFNPVIHHEFSHLCGLNYVEDLRDMEETITGKKYLFSIGFEAIYIDENGIFQRNPLLEEARGYSTMDSPTYDFYNNPIYSFKDKIMAKFMEILVDYYNLQPHQVTLREFLEQIYKRPVTANDIEDILGISKKVRDEEMDINQAINHIDQLIREGVQNE